uniref:Uncharacterized protein n=1 Tax=Timema shepardi TaxID=629360 RepID=A0A7R9G3Y0_TIMSH|nr:unnamed protein product [Timema shepardi]
MLEMGLFPLVRSVRSDIKLTQFVAFYLDLEPLAWSRHVLRMRTTQIQTGFVSDLYKLLNAFYFNADIESRVLSCVDLRPLLSAFNIFLLRYCFDSLMQRNYGRRENFLPQAMMGIYILCAPKSRDYGGVDRYFLLQLTLEDNNLIITFTEHLSSLKVKYLSVIHPQILKGKEQSVRTLSPHLPPALDKFTLGSATVAYSLGSALYCYNCGSIMSMKGGCDNAANKKLVTLEKCQPNVKRCFNLKTSTDKTVSRGCLTEAVDYYCTGLGYCETCQGDFCNGNTNFHSGLAKLFKFAKEA